MTDRENDAGPIIPGPYLSPQQTENSPLKHSILGSTKKSIENWLWGWDFSLDGAGSLKSVVVLLFGTAGVVTLALLTQIYKGETQLVRHGAVASDHPDCTQIGVDMLERGGHAVDAAIAAAMCLGVVHFHDTGLGGGGFLLGYNQRRQKVLDVVNFTPSMPASGLPLDFSQPGQTVGVPGMLAGLWAAHQRHGRLAWADLIMPSVELARNGFTISPSLAYAASCLKPGQHSPELAELLTALSAGHNASLPRLGATLELIASKGAQVLYNGSLADEIVYAVKVGNGSMAPSDLASYSPVLGFSEKTTFQDFDIVVPASSFGGTFLLNALETIQVLELRPEEDLTAEMVRKLSDVLYDTQMSLIEKSLTVKEMRNPAGCGVAVMDSDDNYVSVVSGLNSVLGSQLLTDSGFILNNALVNGGLDRDGRPVSLATPVIAVQRGRVCGQRIVSGAADARSLAQVLTQLITFREATNSSVEAPRFHLGPVPRSILLEDHRDPQFSNITVSALQGMEISVSSESVCSQAEVSQFIPYGGINVVSKIEDIMWPYADSRGGGEALQF